MTKKSEHEARVLRSKRDAYLKKVRTLVGYVGPRVSSSDAIAKMDAGVTAEKFAADLAALEPVGRAVFPLKLEAVQAANDWAQKRVAAMTAKLEENGWDLGRTAPSPRFDDADYRWKQMTRSEYHHITRSVHDVRRHGEPEIVRIDAEGVARFVADAERDAADMYDAFACKLVAKVGPCDDAQLSGSHVWSHSILTVRKGSTVERWKTQQITNVSVLGKYFPQWPTRIVK